LKTTEYEDKVQQIVNGNQVGKSIYVQVAVPLPKEISLQQNLIGFRHITRHLKELMKKTTIKQSTVTLSGIHSLTV
jgi:thiamine biosynthesis lipoprotein ApbE